MTIEPASRLFHSSSAKHHKKSTRVRRRSRLLDALLAEALAPVDVAEMEAAE